MIEDWILSLVYASWLAASTMPVGFMLGASCSPCCNQDACGGGKSSSDPADEGDWVPSGSWPSVSWTFNATPSEKEWFFYGSLGTSKKGGGASVAEREDWSNLCNWYSASSHSPETVSTSPSLRLIRRATSLPTSDAIIHVYSTINTGSARTVKTAYFHGVQLKSGSSLTATTAAYGTTFNTVFLGGANNSGTITGGALFGAGGSDSGNRNNTGATVNDGAEFLQTSRNQGTVSGGFTFKNNTLNDTSGTVNGGGTFSDSAYNAGTASGGATFNGTSPSGNDGTVNNGATFNTNRLNNGTVNGGATFNNAAKNNFGGTVHGGATFNNNSRNFSTINDSATFNGTSGNSGTVNGGATFNDTSENSGGGTVNGGAAFNDTSENSGGGTVNGGATFNDAACSRRLQAGGTCTPAPCSRKFVAHPTDLPTCSGTAPTGCANSCAALCGCG